VLGHQFGSDSNSHLKLGRKLINAQTVFGQNYDASYAPLTDGAGKLTGALFVGVPK